MPLSGALTDHVAGQVMELATLIGNNDIIEEYISGAIDPADFQDLITRAHGIRGQRHRAYLGIPFDSRCAQASHHAVTGGQADAPGDTPPTVGAASDLDTRACLDLTMLEDARIISAGSTYPGGNASTYLGIGDGVWQGPIRTRPSFLLFERLGLNPDMSGGHGGPTPLRSYDQSWHNWRWDGDLLGTDYPGGIQYFASGTDYKYENHLINFNDTDTQYYDRWMTVPYCSMRIWVPDPCILIVVASATGTCNSSLGGLYHPDGTLQDWREAGHTVPQQAQNDTSNEFRLFLDSDNRPGNTVGDGGRTFSWYAGEGQSVNRRLAKTNWIPHTSVNGANPTRGITITNAPRATFLLASEFKVPTAGYYNVSMRYNAPYFFGGVNFSIDPNEYVSDAYCGVRNDHWVSRWEHCHIGAVSCLGSLEINHDNADLVSETYEDGLGPV